MPVMQRARSSARRSRVRGNENVPPTTRLGRKRSGRKRSSSFADLPYNQQRNLYVAYSSQEAREREEVSRPTFTRRSSYITIVTSLPNGAINQTDLELDFSEAEIERLMNMAEPAPALEHENHIQWQWAGPRIPCSEGGATFESREDGLLKGNPFEEAFNPWKTTLEDFTRRYTAPQGFQTGQGACSSLEATESGSATLRLKSVSSRLDANASTLEHALTRLQETLSAERVLSSTMTSVFDDDRVAHDSREGSGKLSPTSTYVDSEDETMEILGHRAEKLPSSEHVLAKLCSTAIETVALVREMSESVAKLDDSQ